jgi:hypothetical protein
MSIDEKKKRRRARLASNNATSFSEALTMAQEEANRKHRRMLRKEKAEEKAAEAKATREGGGTTHMASSSQEGKAPQSASDGTHADAARSTGDASGAAKASPPAARSAFSDAAASSAAGVGSGRDSHLKGGMHSSTGGLAATTGPSTSATSPVGTGTGGKPAGAVAADPKPVKLGKWAKMKLLWKDHGIVFVVYWCGVWVACIPPIYGAIVLTGFDGLELLQTIQTTLYGDNPQHQMFDMSNWDPALVNFVVAMEINELCEIVRFPLVVMTTPAVSGWWRSGRPELTEEQKQQQEERQRWWWRVAGVGGLALLGTGAYFFNDAKTALFTALNSNNSNNHSDGNNGGSQGEGDNRAVSPLELAKVAEDAADQMCGFAYLSPAAHAATGSTQKQRSFFLGLKDTVSQLDRVRYE